MNANKTRVSEMEERKFYPIDSSGDFYSDYYFAVLSEGAVYLFSVWVNEDGSLRLTETAGETEYQIMKIEKQYLTEDFTLEDLMYEMIEWYDLFMQLEAPNPQGIDVIETEEPIDLSDVAL